MAYQRLTAQDTSFLHLENATTPMHVGALILMEAGPLLDEAGHFRIDDVRALVERRLDNVPRFRQKLMEVPFGQGRPVWVDDDRFDLSFHVRLTALPRPGTEDQLRALMGRIQSTPLDRRRPLWEVWFVEGVEGDRVALIHKAHHAMVDGVASVDVATLLFDLEPSPADDGEPSHWEPTPAPSPAQLLAETLIERAFEPAEMARTMRAAMRGPQAVMDAAREVGKAVQAVGAVDAPRLPFNAPIGPHRRFDMARADLARVRAIKAAAGCTVNDVVLAVVTGALRRFLEGMDVPVDGLVVKTLVPVSVRADAEASDLGNRVAGIVAELPVGEPDPAERLRILSASLAELKESGQAVGLERINQLLDFAPPTLLGLAARLVPLQRAVNMVVTNVPGPQIPLYCMGSQLLEIFPYVGIADSIGLVVAVVSYDGELGFGLTGDRDLLPDLGVLAEEVEKAVGELAAAVGVPA
jgi:diacylglycerol O-acyltransferase